MATTSPTTNDFNEIISSVFDTPTESTVLFATVNDAPDQWQMVPGTNCHWGNGAYVDFREN
ncbi:hypothetical protein ACFSSC_04755 [Corynebacterium mendelii]|uniref:Uncharacterized protein n=1 Tax=Corynebacterium mendelii TaxID=2765362 RepID=A0A939DYR3_9CORY|nr:hypothetical protein [Corynebacterium mendelii]MBN9643290.1 hypothetical protein [Corynebacterium mendelii]